MTKFFTEMLAGLARWIVVSLVLLVLVVVAFGVWSIQTSNSLHRDANIRSNLDLAIITDNIAGWPVSLQSLAEAFFVPSKLTTLDRSATRWVAKTTVSHPLLGNIVYLFTAVADANFHSDHNVDPSCGDESHDRVDIKRINGKYWFQVFGKFTVTNDFDINDTLDSTETIEYSQHSTVNHKILLARTAPTRDFSGNALAENAYRRALADHYQKFVDFLGPKSGLGNVICYSTSVPLAGIVPEAELGRFERVLIAKKNGDVVAQLGGPDVPVTHLAELTSEPGPSQTKAPASSEGSSAQGSSPEASLRQASTPQASKPLTETMDPTKVHVGGVAYMAYIRPFYFDLGSTPPTKKGPDATKQAAHETRLVVRVLDGEDRGATDGLRDDRDPSGEHSPSEDRGRQAGQDEFLAVALVPLAAQEKEFFRLPPQIIVLFGLPLLLFVALIPVLKLRMIGPAEAMSRVELVALAAGTTVSAALATASVMFIVDLNRLEADQANTAKETLSTLSRQFAGEFRSAETSLYQDWSASDPANCLSQPLAPDATQLGEAFPARSFSPDVLEIYPAEASPWSPIITREAADMTLPPRESVYLVDARAGRVARGTRVVSCRGNAGARFSVYDRSYFRNVVEGDVFDFRKDWRVNDSALYYQSPGLRVWPQYAIDVIRSRTDGLPKIVVAHPALDRRSNPIPAVVAHPPSDHGPSKSLPFDPKNPLSFCNTPLESDPPSERGCFTAVFAYSMTNRTFLAPVIPDGMQFVVVNLDDAKLPVLFHSDSSRATYEMLAVTLDAPSLSVVRTKLLAQSSAQARAIAFSGQYDGAHQQFYAKRLTGTHWALLIFYPDSLPSNIAARTLISAIWVWCVITMMVSVLTVCGIFLLVNAKQIFCYQDPLARRDITKQEINRWPWPRKNRRRFYRLSYIMGAPSMGCLLAWLFFKPPQMYDLAIMAAAVAASGGMAYINLSNVNLRDPESSDSNRTKQDYIRYLIVIAFGISVIPMAVCYSGSMELSREHADYYAFTSQRDAEHERYKAEVGIVRVLRPYEDGPFVPPREETWFSGGDHGGAPPLLGFAPRTWLPLDSPCDPAWLAFLYYRLAPGGFPHFVVGGAGAQPGRTFLNAHLYGKDEDDECSNVSNPPNLYSVSQRPFELFRDDRNDDGGPWTIRLSGWTSILVVLTSCLVVMIWIINVVRCRLFGLGVPIHKIRYPAPPLNADPKSLSGLGALSIIVGAPLRVRRWLLEPPRAGVDLSVGSQPPMGPYPPVVVFYNFELTLEDGRARRRALRALEDVCASDDVRGGRAQVILLTALSPLERVVQAYEEKDRLDRQPSASGAGNKDSLARSRENLRWSQLFSLFTTYGYAEESYLKAEARRDLPTQFVFDELSVLPEHVVCALVGSDPGSTPDRQGLELSIEKLTDWIDANIKVKDESRADIVEFLSMMLTEYYQYIWAQSSRAERLLLFNLARGRAVSVLTARHLLSVLVLRGLVVMDWGPRIMNYSFANFVQHVETPERVADYLRGVPRGGWYFVRILLGLFVPIALLGLAFLLLEAGLGVESIAPLATVALPALIQAVFAGRRGAAG